MQCSWAEVIPTIRPAINQQPLLAKGETPGKERSTRHAQTEKSRRGIECKHLEELSRYYPRAYGLRRRSELLAKGNTEVFDALKTFH